MDRSLRRRTILLIVAILACVGLLLPTFSEVPSWFPFKRTISLGLDLQGGSHIVYSIDLDKAVDDKAHEIRRDLEARFKEEWKIEATALAPLSPLGAVTVVPKDASKRAELERTIKESYSDQIQSRDCAAEDGANAICFQVSQQFAETTKKSALANAVMTIRERIDEKGVAEPSVVEKGDQIIVELPGLDDDKKNETRDLIARTAKLEFKVVDDGSKPGVAGRGTEFMQTLYAHVGEMSKEDAEIAPPSRGREAKEGDPTDKLAQEMGIYARTDYWQVEEQPDRPHGDYFLKAYDRPNELVSVEEAKKLGCIRKGDKKLPQKPEVALARWFGEVAAKLIADQMRNVGSASVQGLVRCDLKGWQVIGRYMEKLAAIDPKFKIPDDHQFGYELEEPTTGDDKRPYWRSYYLWRAVRLTGTAITNAVGAYEPNSGRPIVSLDFNRYGGRVFADLTAEIVGQKLATILDDKVKSAPTINGAIRGGRATITMGGGADPDRQLKDRDDLVNVLKTGSLPAPLREDSISDVGPTLGRDAIAKTQLSFLLGIGLVILIMVGVYKWSGWIAVFAVTFHVLVTLAVMALFGATLTLPGIAALVLSIGMCVDGNILINERIRDELLLGKSVRGAVDLGFSRAFSAILDGQFTIAASAWVLLQYGSGPIKGFAVMMLVGVFTTVATNTWVTRILFDAVVSRKKAATTLSI